MKQILKMNPEERMNVDDALKHPYMEGLSEEFEDADEERDRKDNKGSHLQIQSAQAAVMNSKLAHPPQQQSTDYHGA